MHKQGNDAVWLGDNELRLHLSVNLDANPDFMQHLATAALTTCKSPDHLKTVYFMKITRLIKWMRFDLVDNYAPCCGITGGVRIAGNVVKSSAGA